MSDERAGLPSASAIPRYAECPGSYLLSLGIPEIQTPEMKAYAEAGDRIHLWLEDPNFITLEGEELDVAEMCADQRDQVINKVLQSNFPGVTVSGELIKEERLWLLQGRKRVFSGRSDDTRIFQQIVGLIIDFKSGRGDVAESPKNRQLRSLAVTLWRSKYGKKLQKIYVAIVQPLVNREPLICCYEVEDLKQSETELVDLLVQINDPKAPRKVNDYCKFCPGKFRCPEFSAALEKIASSKPDTLEGTALAELLNLCSFAAPVIEAVKSRAKELLKINPEAVPGWMLGKPGTVRSITDPFAAFKALKDGGLLTTDQFLNDCVSVGVGDLEKAIAKHNSLKAAAAKETVNSVCGPFIELKTKQPSLEKLS